MIFCLGQEALLISLVLLLGVVKPQLGWKWFRKSERALAAIARRRRTSVLLCGGLALALRTAILPILPYPVPHIHDEFSFLLAADTFSHGRLTNPTPPMWIHFETLHIILTPTYQSMYPPLQGVFLAAGKLIGGHPFWGVWLSVGLMCATICWMLQAWMPPTWALIGGMVPVLRFGVFYWAASYWGGAPAAIGGALVLGALPRIVRQGRIRHSVLMALGTAMLANSRPYEGLLLSGPAYLALLYWWRQNKWKLANKTLWTKIALPLTAGLLIFSFMTCYYFWRVTGSPFRMPYQVNRDYYSTARYFYWQSPHPVLDYHHAELRRFYLHEFQRYQDHRSLKGFLWETGFKMGLFWLFYVGPALTIPLLAACYAYRDRRVRFLATTAGVCAVGISLVIYFAPHYAAPATCIIVAFIVQGLRHLRAWHWDGRPTGPFLAYACILVCVLMVPVQIFVLHERNQRPGWQEEGSERQQILAHLESLPGRQLVFVHYAPDHDVLAQEWVYNDADIPHAKVIWARDMGGAQNERLLDCYSNRQSWYLEPDRKPPTLTAYKLMSSDHGQHCGKDTE